MQVGRGQPLSSVPDPHKFRKIQGFQWSKVLTDGVALGIESKALPWWIRADENEHQTLVKNGLTN
jgi:hypothetical protein